MKIVYDSKTGLGQQFAESLDQTAQSIAYVNHLDEPAILVTRNVGRGKIPKTTKRFLKQFGHLVVGVVINGDRRFGASFCGAGPRIEKKYGIKVIRNIEGSGTKEDQAYLLNYLQHQA
jgi:protein involved in ribonucleotide reduction